ncbi:MAG: glycolate oxidase iron-sulfur subunit [bacterium]|nr:MAG: glycolate oxidase iron-sulfur subunit [bacterium]
MDQFLLLKDRKKDMDKCVLCGGCHSGCPTYDLSRYEHDSARGKVLLARALLDGEIKPDMNLYEKFDHCLTCMSCAQACPAGADPVNVIIAARSEIYERTAQNKISRLVYEKILPEKQAFSTFAACMSLALKIYAYLPPVKLPFARGGVKRKLPDFSVKGIRGSYPEIIKAEGAKTPILRVAYFAGCMTDRAFHDTFQAVVDVLSSAGVEVVLPKDEICCGAPAFFAGDRKSAVLMAKKNVKTFSLNDIDYIVTSCATCGSMLKDFYTEILGDSYEVRKFTSRVIDFQQIVSERIWDRLVFKKIGEKPLLKVTYHDPCHLSRGMKITDPPRDILKRHPCVEYVEMDSASNCCGGAGSFALKYYDDALEIGQSKADSIIKTGAEVVATACPSCRMQLADALNRAGCSADVTHTAVILRWRLDR